MRISKEPAERKQEIIDTAMLLFYEKGYEKTSISDIAKAMNVAQGLFYRYFPSKEVLFDTAVEQYAQLQADQMTAFLKTSQQKKAANVDTDVDETASADERMPAGEAMPVDETASAGGMTLIDIVKQMPTFIEAEQENSYMKKVFHGPGSKEIHMRLSVSICSKMKPVVRRLLDEANQRGETHIQDTEAAASFCVYGQLGILMDQTIPGEERVERVKTFLIEVLKNL